MDIFKLELDGSMFRFILGVPLDVGTILSLLLLSQGVAWRYLKRAKRYGPVVVLTFSSGSFAYYYLLLRDRLLDSTPIALACIAVLFTFLAFLPLALSRNRSETIRFARLKLLAWTRRASGTVVALLLFIPALPFIVIISLAIRLTSPGPVFTRTLAFSRAGRTFILYNFRIRNIYESTYEKEPFILTSLSDPRIKWSRIFSFLQKSGLHALPRLWNVLKGDICFIGVSPLERPELLSAFSRTLLENDAALVLSKYSTSDNKVSLETIEYCLPVGLVTYAELLAYHIRPWEAILVKDLDLRARLIKEADYFTRTPFVSIRLFAKFCVRSVFRLLNSVNLIKLREASGPLYEPEQ